MPQSVLHSLDDFERGIAAHPRVLLFKHSPICPTSHAAHEQWQRFLGAHPDVPALFVDVIADRRTARGLAEACGVPHASPQAILFVDGRPAWDASHGGVLVPALERAWESASS
ncbi:MAG: DUF2847 family protein [Planctomycetes bacterium]|nr:DUF2847 family protein [Planctomycetota bacterium]